MFFVLLDAQIDELKPPKSEPVICAVVTPVPPALCEMPVVDVFQ